jgi:hypothetical protein
MRLLVLSLCLSSLLPMNAVAQKPVDGVEVGQDHFEAGFPSSGRLRMRIRSGDIKITGSAENKIQVHFGGMNGDRLKDVKVSLRALGDNEGELNISGGPSNRFEVEIAVPKSCDLYVRIPAGEVQVKGITGDKDIELTAGDLTVEVSRAEDYTLVDASVMSGDLNAEPFAISKSGLFRSFQQHGPGKYRLRVHMMAGELTLKQSSEL